MGEVLRVLLVEDVQSNIDLWEFTVNLFNTDVGSHGFTIDTTVVKSAADALDKLDSRRLDAAVVDLRLHDGGVPIGHDEDGNFVVKRILETRPLGVLIFTGQAGDVAPFECSQVRTMDRGDGLQPVLEWLENQSKLLFHLRAVMDIFDAQTANIFFKSIWPRWQHWTASADNEVDLTKQVARHVIAHAHDSMLYAAGDKVHPEETYFVPPIKSRLDTGDLINLDGEVWIVVTPRCDMAHEDNVKSIVLSRCVDISEKWNQLCGSNSNGSKKAISKLVHHDASQKKHFLPRLSDQRGGERGPWLAQFHDLKIVDAMVARTELPDKRFASLAPEFIPSLTERFGSCFSRIGTPDLSGT